MRYHYLEEELNKCRDLIGDESNNNSNDDSSESDSDKLEEIQEILDQDGFTVTVAELFAFLRNATPRFSYNLHCKIIFFVWKKMFSLQGTDFSVRS